MRKSMRKRVKAGYKLEESCDHGSDYVHDDHVRGGCGYGCGHRGGEHVHGDDRDDDDHRDEHGGHGCGCGDCRDEHVQNERFVGKRCVLVPDNQVSLLDAGGHLVYGRASDRALQSVCV